MWCLLIGHAYKACGRALPMPEQPDEYEEWGECSRCGLEASRVHDEYTLIGRIRAWWYCE